MDATDRPFSVERQRGVLTLTLSTPNCDVNIFNNQAADQLVEVLAGLPPETRAVVLKSAKPGSFVNGVGLLMAMAVKSVDNAAALTRGVRAAYHAIRDCPVPTIAAIEGNCYGCGVELSLMCDYRVAADTATTHFYMTEVNDYLFLPIFEGTLRLPLLLGLEAAADLLLWRKRWLPPQARQRGLVDATFPRERFARDVDGFVDEVLQVHGGKPPPRASADASLGADERAAAVEAVRARIRRLPAQLQGLYEQCLDLMSRATEKGRVTEPDAALEIEYSSRSSITPMAKSALSFFLIRQATHQRCLGPSPEPEPELHLAFAGRDPEVARWHATFATRRLPRVTVLEPGTNPPVGARTIRFVPYSDLAPGQSRDATEPPTADEGAAGAVHRVAVAGSRAPGLVWPTRTALFNPFQAEPPILEVAVRDEVKAADRLVYQLLTRAGFHAVFSRPRRRFVLQDALASFLAPLVRHVLAKGRVPVVDGALWSFGFTRRAREVVRSVGLAPLASWLAPAVRVSPDVVGEVLGQLGEAGQPVLSDGGEAGALLVSALCASLLRAARQWRAEGALSHAGMIDVVVRDALDFPLLHGSLLTYLSHARVRELAAAGPRLGGLLSEQDLEALEADARSGEGTYL